MNRFDRIAEHVAALATENHREMYDTIVREIPILKNEFSASNLNTIRSVWNLMIGEGAGEVELGTSREMLDGPYGSMENSKVQDVTKTLRVRTGQPWDKNRCSIHTTTGYPYWVDDEGNISRGSGGYGGGGGYGRSRYKRW